jgi:hypothetical protein
VLLAGLDLFIWKGRRSFGRAASANAKRRAHIQGNKTSSSVEHDQPAI